MERNSDEVKNSSEICLWHCLLLSSAAESKGFLDFSYDFMIKLLETYEMAAVLLSGREKAPRNLTKVSRRVNSPLRVSTSPTSLQHLSHLNMAITKPIFLLSPRERMPL